MFIKNFVLFHVGQLDVSTYSFYPPLRVTNVKCTILYVPIIDIYMSVYKLFYSATYFIYKYNTPTNHKATTLCVHFPSNLFISIFLSYFYVYIFFLLSSKLPFERFIDVNKRKRNRKEKKMNEQRIFVYLHLIENFFWTCSHWLLHKIFLGKFFLFEMHKKKTRGDKKETFFCVPGLIKSEKRIKIKKKNIF